MKVAFVGKGGCGKTTVAALFTQLLVSQKNKNVYAVDADLNVHLSRTLGFEDLSGLDALSSNTATEKIKKYLIGNNKKIKSYGHFKKSTPPARDSNLVYLSERTNFLFKNYTLSNGNLYISIVGTYEKEKIGLSCYHNNLSILENILSHSIDKDAYLVVDMVAGIDAFANTLHAQFDALVLVVEPTVKSVEVFNQYKILAQEAGVYENIFVVGTKVRDKHDRKFVLQNVDESKIIGFIGVSSHVRSVDRGEESLNLDKLETENMQVLKKLLKTVSKIRPNYNKRLQNLHDLHKKYVAQDYVKERFGDLADQIDEGFKYE